jgi:hypothetical protein
MIEMSFKKTVKRNDAELGGLSIGVLDSLHDGHYDIGTIEWAAQQTIQEKWRSIADFREFFDSLEPAQQQGWLSLLKGRSAEHLVAFEEGGTVHSDWNVPASDIVTPEGDLIQVKTGSSDYISTSRQDVPSEIEVHSGIEGDGIEGVEAHSWSDRELTSALTDSEIEDNHLTEILGGSLAIGTALSGIAAYQKIKAGEIAPNEAPRIFMLNVAGKSVRAAIVGVTVTSNSPVIVTAGSAYILYKNYDLVKRFASGTIRAIKNPLTVRVASQTGRYAMVAVGGTGRGAYQVAKHPTTRSVVKNVAKGIVVSTKVTAKGLYRGISSNATKTIARGSAKVVGAGTRGLLNLLTKKRRK